MIIEEPPFWGSWKGRVIEAIAIYDVHGWESIREIPELSTYSSNKALAELFELGVLLRKKNLQFTVLNAYLLTRKFR